MNTFWIRIQDCNVHSKDYVHVRFTGLVNHKILLNNMQPFKQRHRTILTSMYTEVSNHIKQLLGTNVIRKSHSPRASNIVIIQKRDNGLRLCVNYRQLNTRTIKDAYTLPRNEECLDNFGRNQFYSVINIHEEHKANTA